MSGPGALPESSLVLIGWDFHKTPVVLRERLAFSPEKAREALHRITREGLLTEGVIVSTCNRSEIYGVAVNRPGNPTDAVNDFVAGFQQLSGAEIAALRYGCSGGEAARHLFRVAAGLESLVVGEHQILAQVKEAFRLASSAGATHSILHRLFQRAFAAGKRVRSETGLGTRPTSIPGVAMELAQKIYEDIDARCFLILGAGETASIFHDLLIDRGVRSVEILNRSIDRAATLAARGGTARKLEELPERLPWADIVVSATSSPEPILRKTDVVLALSARRGKPMLFLDLGVPRNIDPAAADVDNAYLYSVDDLQAIAARNRAERGKDVPRAEEILEEEVRDFLSWYGSLAVVPTLTGLREKFDRIRRTEFDEPLSRLSIAESEREKISRIAESMVKSLLRDPTSALKDEEDPARRLERAESLRHLFGLDEKSQP